MYAIILERLELYRGGPGNNCGMVRGSFPSLPEKEEDGVCSKGKQ